MTIRRKSWCAQPAIRRHDSGFDIPEIPYIRLKSPTRLRRDIEEHAPVGRNLQRRITACPYSLPLRQIDGEPGDFFRGFASPPQRPPYERQRPHGDHHGCRRRAIGDERWARRVNQLTLPKRLLELQPRIPDVPQPAAPVLLQATAHDGAHALGYALRQLIEIRLRHEYSAQDLGHQLALHRSMARQRLVKHAAKGPNVGPRIERFPSYLLRTHVGRRPHHYPGLRRRRSNGFRHILFRNHSPAY